MSPAVMPRTAEASGGERELGPLEEHCPDAGNDSASSAAGPDHGPAAGRRPGRPRSKRAEQAIIEATLELFAEKGAEGLCVEEVAARAGVGKATLYRRWRNKEDLLLAALGSMKSPLPETDGDSVRADLIALVTVMAEDAADPRRTRQHTLLLGEGAKYPRLMARYAETVVEPRRDVIRSVLRRGMANGQLRPDLDVEIAMLTLTGAAMSRGKYDPVVHSADFAEHVVDSLLLGLAPR